jgi:hypothetical protein
MSDLELVFKKFQEKNNEHYLLIKITLPIPKSTNLEEDNCFVFSEFKNSANCSIGCGLRV